MSRSAAKIAAGQVVPRAPLPIFDRISYYLTII